MRAILAKLDSSRLTLNESARLRCEAALELKDRGEYDRAQEIMRPFWNAFGERPNTEKLHPSIAAELLLHVGILTRWIGSKDQVKESSQVASDLISESITFWESEGDIKKIAAARAELAYCYWREGAFDEARIMFTEALKKLTAEGNTRANALLGLSIVEWSASRYNDSLKVLTDNAYLFEKVKNHTTKGTYHNQLAIVLRSLATAEKRNDYFEQAIKEYIKADQQFKLAHNTVFRGNVKNNVGFLLFKLGRFKAANDYLTAARRLAVNAKDKILVAQFDDSLAKLFIATNQLAEADAAARRSIDVLDKSGHSNTLADSLITYGIVLARLHQIDQAQFIFQRAIELAHSAGALSTAGIASLTMIEEIDQLSAETLSQAYEQAGEWLSTCQSQELWFRFKLAGKKVVRGLRSWSQDAIGIPFNKPCHMPKELLQFERRLISQALATANGRVTHAAKWLGIGRQRLAYIIETRHPDLLKERSPIRRRSRKTASQNRERTDTVP
jgi:tetratricopeptide (TPR) repeat protein